MARVSFSFVDDLLSLNLSSDNLTMENFDVKSLFTKIALVKTIDIILTTLFTNSTHFHDFTRNDFTKILHLSVKICHVLFNGVLYEQIERVVAGSLLGLPFADVFLISWHECTSLDNCLTDFKPVFIIEMSRIVF